MSAVFITASGTGLGKTLVTATLAHQIRRAGGAVRVLKPVISGFDPDDPAGSDTLTLLRALDVEASAQAIERMSPWRYRAPLSPHMAAAAEAKALAFADLIGCCRKAIAAAERDSTTLLIEGVGGVMVPLTDRETVLDWIGALDAGAVLVVGTYLGALSHALTAAAALAARDIRILSVVVSDGTPGEVGLDPTVRTLRDFLPSTPVVPFAWLGPGDARWSAAPPLVGACIGSG